MTDVDYSQYDFELDIEHGYYESTDPRCTITCKVCDQAYRARAKALGIDPYHYKYRGKVTNRELNRMHKGPMEISNYVGFDDVIDTVNKHHVEWHGEEE